MNTNSVIQHVRLLPLLVLVATLSFAVRFGEAVTGVKQFSASAFAEETTAQTSAASAIAQSKELGEKMQAMKAAKPEATIAKDAQAPKEMPQTDAKDVIPAVASDKWKDAGDEDLEYSDVKTELIEDLAKRRKELDARDKDIMRREALIKAAEQELDQKFQELTALRKQIEGLLNKQNEEETARMQSLVKIYEGMKPADAARIFNTLDLDILIDVIGRMSERKSSSILAAMDADRARTITIMLAEQKKLPSLPPQ